MTRGLAQTQIPRIPDRTPATDKEKVKGEETCDEDDDDDEDCPHDEAVPDDEEDLDYCAPIPMQDITSVLWDDFYS
eukprot:4500355-Prorocentrum_lima.AAC.1